MSDGNDEVVKELKLLREQQWTMHLSLLGEVKKTNERLDQTVVRLDKTVERLDQTVVRLDSLEGKVDSGFARLENRIDGLDQKVDSLDQKIDSLDRKMEHGFAQVVAHGNRLQSAFERFVELVLEERRRLLPKN